MENVYSGIPNLTSPSCGCLGMCKLLFVVLILVGKSRSATEAVVIDQLTPCSALINGGLINLRPLARYPTPRLNTVFMNWNYSFNPCVAFDMGNPSQDLGDGCLSVSVCKYAEEYKNRFYYTLGFQSGAKFMIEEDEGEEEEDEEEEGSSGAAREVRLVFLGYRSFRNKKTYINLVCDRNRTNLDDAKFSIVEDKGPGDITAELRHLCCCLDGCPDIQTTQRPTKSSYHGNSLNGDLLSSDTFNSSEDLKHNSSKVISISENENVLSRMNSKKAIIIVTVNLGVVLLAGMVGMMCYNKRTHLRIYHKLPGIRAAPELSLWQLAGVNDVEGGQPDTTPLGSRISDIAGKNSKAGYRDYEKHISRRQSLTFPVLENCGIPLDLIQLGQRLGGSIFGDTHMAEWSGLTVAVKRITLSVHENQLNLENMKWLQEEVSFLSHQRHRNIVSVLGLCTESKHPYIISEFIKGLSVKDFIKHSGCQLTWPHRVKMLSQVADGMAFLHSTSPPILHRDLRCANMFITDNDVIKVADFGLVKLMQPLRAMCQAKDCCCQGLYSGCPPSIAWTAPEVLQHANSDETEGFITTACDVYSYAIVMWELVMCEDPFDEIATAQEVMDTILEGGRPELPDADNVFPLFKDLMKQCWNSEADKRPNFKQITVRLKEVMYQARAFQKLISSRNKS